VSHDVREAARRVRPFATADDTCESIYIMLFFLIVLYPLQVQVARQISTSVLAIHVDTVERVKTE